MSAHTRARACARSHSARTHTQSVRETENVRRQSETDRQRKGDRQDRDQNSSKDTKGILHGVGKKGQCACTDKRTDQQVERGRKIRQSTCGVGSGVDDAPGDVDDAPGDRELDPEPYVPVP